MNKIKPFISAQRIVLGVGGRSQREIFESLIAPLVKEDIVTDPEQFLADLARREAEVTTVMDNGVALPHARSRAVRRLALSVGITAEEGVKFDPESEQVTRLFFCMAVPAFAPTAHIPLLQSLAGFARDEARVGKLVAVKTPGAASRMLSQFRGT